MAFWEKLKSHAFSVLRRSERITKTDMVYLASGSFWLMLAQGVGLLISFISAIAFANFLPAEIYGTYKYILSVGVIFGAFSLQTGLGIALVRAVACGFDGTLRYAFRKNIQWSIPMVLGFFVGAAYYYINGNSMLGLSLFIAGIFTPIMQSAQLYQPFLTGKKDFKKNAIYGIAVSIIPSALVVLTLLFTHNIYTLILVYFLGNTGVPLINYFRTLAFFKPNKKIDKDILRFSKHLSFMSVLTTVSSKLDSVLIFHYLGAAEVAIYFFATAIPQHVIAVFRHIGTLSFPKFSVKTPKEIQQQMHKRGLLILLAVIATMGLYFFAAPFVYTIFFPKYAESIPYSQAAILTLISIVSILPGTALNAMKAVREQHIVVIVGSLLQIGLLFVCVKLYGLWGAIMANVATKTSKMLLTYYFFGTFIRKQPAEKNQ